MSTAGSNLDTTLGVYTGNTLAKLKTIRENDDQNFDGGVLTSKLTFTAIAGTTYHILIDGYRGDSGDIKLKITQTALPKIPQFLR